MIDIARPLYDDIAEQGILGAILTRPDQFEDMGLTVQDFYWNNHQLIYGAMQAIVQDGGSPDMMAVNAKLQQTKQLTEAGGPVKLAELVRDASFGMLVPEHAEILKELSRLRGLHRLAQEIELQVAGGAESNKIASHAEQKIDALYSSQMGGKWASMESVTKETLEKIDAAYQGKTLIGIPTGLKALDRMLGGLQKTDLVIVAGRPSMGKTSLSLQFAQSAAKGGFKVGIVSLEMSNTQVANRLLAMGSEGLSVEALQRGTLTALGWNSLTTAAMTVSPLPIYLCDDSTCTLSEVKAKAKTLQRSAGLDLLIVDYLQLMQGPDSRSREQEISQIARGFKQLAKRLHVPVVALSQLSRKCEERPDKRPILSDLRESGCLGGSSMVYVRNQKSFNAMKSLDSVGGFTVDSNHELLGSVSNKAKRGFCTGMKPMKRLTLETGHSILATNNHKFMAPGMTWARLDELESGSLIAVPLEAPPNEKATMRVREVRMLALLLGNGCTLPRRPVQYTSHSSDISLCQELMDMANQEFKGALRPYAKHQIFRKGTDKESSAINVFLPATRQVSRNYRNPVVVWLEKYGMFNVRGRDKQIPGVIFSQPIKHRREFIKYLWATDGTVCISSNTAKKKKVQLGYSSSSELLVQQLQWLLQSVGILSSYHCTTKKTSTKEFRTFCLAINSRYFIEKFLVEIGVAGKRKGDIAKDAIVFVRNVNAGWTKYELSDDRSLAYVPVKSITEDTEQLAYDIEVPVTHNFVANGILVHNSIEQDADIVLMIYRDEVYDEDTADRGVAELLVRKHRNGAVGDVRVGWVGEKTLFTNELEGE